MTVLTLEQASTIIDRALQAGSENGMRPLTVAVLDAGGHLVAMKRSDGSGILRPQIAFGKAWGALGVERPSRVLEEGLAGRPAFQHALGVVAEGRLVPAPGGVLICQPDGETIIGAVGISGDTSNKDEYAAIEGIRAAGLAPIPPEPVPDWKTT
ncbi:MAG: heme-binding protein [Alphaproteobacteria bacterium]|nr:heme-binding protein [Alphaproteobacteria bacterium]